MERRLAAVMVADMAGFSRLVEADETGVLTRQRTYRREVFEPEIASRHGRIVKLTGDGFLAEFASAEGAVRAALEIQETMESREGGTDPEARVTYRIGINVGDVVMDEGDIFGDGVNVAARMETIAEPGGICVTDIVHQTMGDRLAAGFRDMGRQRVKNISRPIRVWQWTPDGAPQRAEPEEAAKQKVRFATASDGVQIAWASIGSGVPVLKAPNWLNHVEYEWQNPCWRPFLLECSRRFELIRFDQRGNGLSDRDVEEISEDAMQRDISAVVEAAGLERFALMGISQGAAFSVRYAAENPDRVRCLIILGGYLRGRLLREDTEQHELHRVQADLIRQGWGSPNPVFRHFFTSTFMPDAPPETASSFDELQRVSTHMNEALQIREMNARTDVRALAAKIRVPTLVLHAKGDRVCPIEEGRLVARTIPGASFVELPGNNHALTEGTPALAMFLEEVQDFLARHAG